jgi:hypothetical protein
MHHLKLMTNDDDDDWFFALHMLYLLQFPAAITRTPTTATVVRWMATA